MYIFRTIWLGFHNYLGEGQVLTPNSGRIINIQLTFEKMTNYVESLCATTMKNAQKHLRISDHRYINKSLNHHVTN